MTLEARMALFTEGQVTWPKIGLNQNCTDCRFYTATKKKGGVPHGTCRLVKEIQRMKPKEFPGGVAQACSMFEARAQIYQQ